MTNDRYTKAILSVIALCLIWLCAQADSPIHARQAIEPAASPRPQPVVIVGWGTLDAEGRLTIASTANHVTDPSIPVKVMAMPTAAVDVRLNYSADQPMPVGITMIKPAGAWEPIRSAAVPDPLRSRPGRE